MVISDCNPGIEFSIPGSGIKKFIILGSQDPVSGLGLQINRHSDILLKIDFLPRILLQIGRCLTWSVTDAFDTKSNHRMPRILRMHDIWNAFSLRSSDLVSVQVRDDKSVVQAQFSVQAQS